MATVVLAPTGVEDLDRIINTYTLPESTRARVRALLQPLADFPRLGAALIGPWHGLRFLVGPWPWMLLVYIHDEKMNRITVVTVQDARSARAATSETHSSRWRPLAP